MIRRLLPLIVGGVTFIVVTLGLLVLGDMPPPTCAVLGGISGFFALLFSAGSGDIV